MFSKKLILEFTKNEYGIVNKRTLKEFLKKMLYEGFPTYDTVAKRKRTFFKYEMYKLALNGQHPKYPGIKFKPYKKQDKYADLVNRKFQQTIFKQDFDNFLKSKNKTLNIQKFINKYKLKKNRSEKNLYIKDKIFNLKKLVGHTGYSIIKYFEKLGGKIPFTEKSKV
jgi:hypothetical protein